MELRAFFRLHEPFQIEFTLPPDAGGGQMMTEGTDIGGGGARVTSPKHLHKGEVYKIKLLMDQDFAPLTCMGKIAFCKFITDEQFDIGLHFENLTADQMDSLLTFIGTKRSKRL